MCTREYDDLKAVIVEGLDHRGHRAVEEAPVVRPQRKPGAALDRHQSAILHHQGTPGFGYRVQLQWMVTYYCGAVIVCLLMSQLTGDDIIR